MIDYCYNSHGGDGYIQVKRDHKIQITKESGKIQLLKEEYDFEGSNTYNGSKKYLMGRMSADLVHSQLENVRHVGFEVTDACNLKCTYCIYGDFYDAYDKRTNKKIEEEKAKILLDFLIDKLHSSANLSIQNEVLISFYGGEPLLNIDFIQKIVSYTQKRQDNYVKFNYGITTNAVYLKKYLPFLYQNNFLVTVSLDGNKANDAYRNFHNGNPSFDIVYRNLKHIQDNYPDYFDKNIRFNSVIHDLNNEQEAFSFIRNEFNKTTRFSSLNPTGIRKSMKDKFNSLNKSKLSKPNDISKEMEDTLDLNYGENLLLQDFIFQYSGNMFFDYNELLGNKESYLPTATCIPFSRRIFMTVNNKILPCERIGQQFELGVVTDNGVQIDCDLIAQKYNIFYDSLKEQCQNCLFLKNCTQCMFSINDLGTEKAICNRNLKEEHLGDELVII